MRIAFDAKRAYQNNTGLGNYSRVLISEIAKAFPEHEYYLMAPKRTGMFEPAANIHTVIPQGINKLFKSAWRSRIVNKDLTKLSIDIYHGLSNEIPLGIQNTNLKTVVTIHDLIFERYPEQYKTADIMIYRKKFKNACMYADRIIAISEQTKRDLIDIYKVNEQKIAVCYQSVDPKFSIIHSKQFKQQIREKYKLPEKYFLYVGSIIERKNLLTICEAISEHRTLIEFPLVVIGGSDNKYARKVKRYVEENGLAGRIIFLTDQPESNDSDFRNSNDFPAIYQSAIAMIYPSIFEGFGLPVLEALWSRLPVITSNCSCLPEAGGDAAYYIDPFNVKELGEAMLKIASNKMVSEAMIEKGLAHARNFLPELCATSVMDVYKQLM